MKSEKVNYVEKIAKRYMEIYKEIGDEELALNYLLVETGKEEEELLIIIETGEKLLNHKV